MQYHHISLTIAALVAGCLAASAQEGIASYYGPGFNGHRTASGAIFNSSQSTCAHRSLPFGTRVRVVNLSNGLSGVCVVTDRGPFVRGRIIDLSQGMARRIGLTLGRVRLEVVQ